MKKIALVLFLTACGTEAPEAEPVTPNPGTGGPIVVGPPVPDAPSFAEMTSIHDQYCTRCHGSSAFIQSEKLLKDSTAKQRVQNGSMPLGQKLPPDVKERYLSFFSA